ncbi:MAG TPA: NAD(P)H-dependent oxidoreductase [Treponemataceae bacterium]|nr:NAD(P)H-dependent oxidoreductase [Treponemataceae bacterium]HPS45413.1 NAD(P)H-dependent oxidoreductase [Treponemataceae bacterium]
MKVGILYDSTEPESRALFESVRASAEGLANRIEVIDAGSGTSAPCICCFQCWTKTPGVCVLPRDEGTGFVEKFWDADYLVIISRITWGGYSTRIKSFVDRLIPYLHPYFTIRNGEMHHRFRYDSIPLFLAAGYGARTEGEEATFLEVTEANRDQRGDRLEMGTFIVGRDADAVSAAGACGEWLAKEITR